MRENTFCFFFFHQRFSRFISSHLQSHYKDNKLTFGFTRRSNMQQDVWTLLQTLVLRKGVGHFRWKKGKGQICNWQVNTLSQTHLSQTRWHVCHTCTRSVERTPQLVARPVGAGFQQIVPVSPGSVCSYCPAGVSTVNVTSWFRDAPQPLLLQNRYVWSSASLGEDSVMLCLHWSRVSRHFWFSPGFFSVKPMGFVHWLLPQPFIVACFCSRFHS